MPSAYSDIPRTPQPVGEGPDTHSADMIGRYNELRAQIARVDDHADRLTLAEEIAYSAKRYAKTTAQRDACCDGTSKPLSGYYGTLAAAQVDYPHASALTDELDWAIGQAALNGLRNVYLAEGGWVTNRRFAYRRSGQEVYGADDDKTIIDYRGAGDCAVLFGFEDYDPTVVALQNNYRGIGLYNLQITGTNSTGAAVGVRVFGATRYNMANCFVRLFRTGKGVEHLDYGWIGQVHNFRIEQSERAVHFITHSLNSSNQSANAINYHGGEIGPGCVYGVVVGDELATVAEVPVVGSGINFWGTAIEGTDSWAVWAVSGTEITFNGAYFENNGAETIGVGHIRIGNANLRPQGVHIKGCYFTGTMGADASHIQIDRVLGCSISGNTIGGISTTGTTTGVKLVSASCDSVDIGPNQMGGSVGVHYDYGAAANYSSRIFGVGAIQEYRSGAAGWRWRAAASFIHDFLDAAGTAVARISLEGRVLVGLTSAGRAIEVFQGGLAGTTKAWITDAGLARFFGNIEGEASLYTKLRASFGNNGAYDGTATAVFKGLSTTNKAAVFRRLATTSTANTIEVQNEDGTVTQWAVTPAGLPKWAVAANEQTTVGAAGAAAAPPASPAKYLKVVDSAGTTYVIPAYPA